MAEGDLKGVYILLVEDQEEHREEMAFCLALRGATVVQATNGREALSLFEITPTDLVVSDIRMPEMDGLELTARIKAVRPETPVVLITAFADTPSLVKAIELEVAGLVPKPVDTDALIRVVTKSVLPILQRRELEAIRCQAAFSLEASLGPSQAMAEVREAARIVAATSFSVLLQGETGVGKTYVARLIHELGARRKRPFIQVDLNSIPEALLDSELFGFLKGDLKVAENDRPGRFDAARGGTIFLDDVSSLPFLVQRKLLKMIEEGRLAPHTGSDGNELDVRIIAADTQDAREPESGSRLQRELFFRLAEVEIVLPPLRERPEDIPFLARRFAAEAADELGRPFSGVSAAAETLLRQHHWPGNVRELRNIVRRAFLLSGGDVLSEQALIRDERRAGDWPPPLNLHNPFAPVQHGPTRPRTRERLKNG